MPALFGVGSISELASGLTTLSIPNPLVPLFGLGIAGVDLKDADITQRLDAAGLDILRTVCQVETFEPGAALCRIDDAADRIWIERRGSVGIHLKGSGIDTRVASLGPGCSVGEMGLLDRQPRSADVIC